MARKKRTDKSRDYDGGGRHGGGRHRWIRNYTPWSRTVAGQIEHNEPGVEAPADLGRREYEPRHCRRDNDETAFAVWGGAVA